MDGFFPLSRLHVYKLTNLNKITLIKNERLKKEEQFIRNIYLLVEEKENELLKKKKDF